MDVAEPGRGLAPGLAVPILRALARRSTPVTAARLTRLAGQGTEAGVRRAVERLASHGVCVRDEIDGRVTYSLNHDHVLYRTVTELLRADRLLVQRLKAALAGWDPAPVSAVLFGSAARRDGDLDSDIDLLLVRPKLSERKRQVWAQQVHDLRRQVGAWTGNRLQVVDKSAASVARLVSARERLFENIREEGIWLAGWTVEELLGETP
jgi:predicted nucleotidyltransferase